MFIFLIQGFSLTLRLSNALYNWSSKDKIKFIITLHDIGSEISDGCEEEQVIQRADSVSSEVLQY